VPAQESALPFGDAPFHDVNKKDNKKVF